MVAAKPAPICAESPTELAKEAGLSPAELQVIQSLGARRGELDQREQGLSTELALIQAAEAKVDAKITTMNALKADMQAMLGQLDDKQQAEVNRLVKVYEDMKPQAAAARFTLLTDEVRLPIAAQMKEQKLSAIIANMAPADAKHLTEALAARYVAQANAARAAINPPAAQPPAAPPSAAATQPPPAQAAQARPVRARPAGPGRRDRAGAEAEARCPPQAEARQAPGEDRGRRQAVGAGRADEAGGRGARRRRREGRGREPDACQVGRRRPGHQARRRACRPGARQVRQRRARLGARSSARPGFPLWACLRAAGQDRLGKPACARPSPCAPPSPRSRCWRSALRRLPPKPRRRSPRRRR